jgi:heat shock protein HslJ
VPDDTPAPTPGIGGTWTVVRINDMAAVPRGEPRVQFTVGGQVQGGTGCSDFKAPFVVDGTSLAVGRLEGGYTDPQCQAARRQQEQAFLAVLLTADRIEELGRGRLRLSGPDGEMVLLREGNFDLTDEEQALLADLRERPWTIVKATGLPDDPPLPPLEFGEGLEFADPVFSASGSCGITGHYRLRGEGLIQLHSTSPTEGEACPTLSDFLRARLMDALEVVTHFELDDAGRLTLRGPEEELVFEQH